MTRNKIEQLGSEEGAEGQEGKTNATPIGGPCNLGNTGPTEGKRCRSGEEELPADLDFTVAVKRGRRKGKQNDGVSGPHGNKVPGNRGVKGNGAVLGLGFEGFSEVEKEVFSETGGIGKVVGFFRKTDGERENGRNSLVQEELEGIKIEVVLNNCVEVKEGEKDFLGGKREVEGVFVEENGEEFNLGCGGNKQYLNENQEINLVVEEESSNCNRVDFADGKGRLEVCLVEEEKEVNRKKTGKKRGKEKIMDFEAEGKGKEEENVEDMKTDEEEMENVVSDGVKNDNQMEILCEGDGNMSDEKKGVVKEEKEDLVEENGKGTSDMARGVIGNEEFENVVSEGVGKDDQMEVLCEVDGEKIGEVEEKEGLVGEKMMTSADLGGWASRKRESSRKALQKMEEMKLEWLDSSDEENGGRRKKKPGRKKKKKGDDSVVGEGGGLGVRKNRKGQTSSTDEGKEEEKISETDDEPVVGKEMKQDETKKKRSARKLTTTDKDEEEKVEGSNLSKRERYSLRTKKIETENASQPRKRCRDENVRYLDLLQLNVDIYFLIFSFEISSIPCQLFFLFFLCL